MASAIDGSAPHTVYRRYKHTLYKHTALQAQLLGNLTRGFHITIKASCYEYVSVISTHFRVTRGVIIEREACSPIAPAGRMVLSYANDSEKTDTIPLLIGISLALCRCTH